MVFSGTTSSDFLKLVKVVDRKKAEYVDFAGTDFLSLRQNIIDYVKAVYPLDYNQFVESDIGMMFIEQVAYMGTVLSLKGDMLANENYLRTVKSRSNLKKLLELIGVTMRGPLGSAAAAKITMTTDPVSADFPVTYQANQRVLTVPSESDGAPISYTLYKIANNAIEDIQSIDASLQLEGNEAENATSSIFSNLAMLQGSLQVERGTFDSVEGNKRISLTNSPIIDGSLQVYVNTGNPDLPSNGSYTEVNSIYSASSSSDRLFQTITDDNYGGTVIFGDGVIGASPPPGSEYVVTYRVGGGSRGNMRQGYVNALTTLTTNESNTLTANVENTTPATGGSEAETVEHAKRYAPYTFKTQDRVVSLEDFVAIGNTFRSKQGTIGKTTAVVRDAYSSGNVIDVFVLEKLDDLRLQKASPTFKKELLDEIEPKKMLTDEIVVVDGLIRTMDLVVTIRVDRELEPLKASIEQDASQAILEYFNVDNNDFGKPFISDELNRQIFRVPNIRYSTVDNLPQVVNVEFNEIIQLNNFTINTVFI